MTEERKRAVTKAIDRWYTANYPGGCRLTSQQRASLVAAVNRRLDLVDTAEAMRSAPERTP